MRNKLLGTGVQGYHPWRKVKVAFKGLHYAVFSDVAVAYKLALSIVLMLWCFYYRQWLDFSLVLLATGLMLVAEIFNTVIEAICDFIEPKHNEKIGIIKDMSAGAAGITIGIWVVVIIIEFMRVWEVFSG